MDIGEAIAKDLPGVLAITLGIGAGILIPTVYMITHSWKRVRTVEQNAVLKKAMIDKGMSAEEITAVINAGNGEVVWENDNAVAAMNKMIKHGYSAEDISKVMREGPGGMGKIRG
jgi:SOS response regulatory protein OraA/RecX